MTEALKREVGSAEIYLDDTDGLKIGPMSVGKVYGLVRDLPNVMEDYSFRRFINVFRRDHPNRHHAIFGYYGMPLLSGVPIVTAGIITDNPGLILLGAGITGIILYVTEHYRRLYPGISQQIADSARNDPEYRFYAKILDSRPGVETICVSEAQTVMKRKNVEVENDSEDIQLPLKEIAAELMITEDLPLLLLPNAEKDRINDRLRRSYEQYLQAC